MYDINDLREINFVLVKWYFVEKNGITDYKFSEIHNGSWGWQYQKKGRIKKYIFTYVYMYKPKPFLFAFSSLNTIVK